MTIDWANFTPLHSLLGGLLIGLAAAILIIFNGRIAGVSGIVSGLIWNNIRDSFWRVSFILGLVISPLIFSLASPLPSIENHSNLLLLAFAGLLVGIGTSYGAGCTSGHGVCGISRLSLRSLVATLLFMSSGFVTVFIVKHLIA